MRGIIRAVLAMGLGMGVLMSLSGGCVYHHDHEQVDVVDAQGYHHKGYYDENHGYHDDPHDWAGDHH